MRRRESTVNTLSPLPSVRMLDEEGWTTKKKNKGRKNGRSRRRTSQETLWRREMLGNALSKASDDEYYLRWNPCGDYESDDDDWWKRVKALEQKEHDTEKEKKKKAAASTYRRYKHHTKMVMDWGNSFWDNDNGGDEHLSLRSLIARLNYLALRNIEMPPSTKRDLELAIELREEFSTRFVSQQKSQKGSEEFHAKRRKKRNSGTTKSSEMLSRWPRNIEISETSSNDGRSEDNSSTINKYDQHRWILIQLKELLARFENNSASEKRNSINGCVAQMKTFTEQEKSANSKTRPVSVSIKSLPSADNIGRRAKASQYTQSSSSSSSSFGHSGKIGDVRAVSVSPPLTPDGLCTDDGSCINNKDQSCGWNSGASSKNWHKLFGDDGSRIESNENPNGFSKTRILSVVAERCIHAENENIYLRQRPSTEEPTKPMCPKENSNPGLADNVSTPADHSNNPIRADFQSRNNQEKTTASISIKGVNSEENDSSDGFYQEKKQRRKSERGNDDIVNLKKHSVSKAIDEATSEQSGRLKQYDSVWDSSFHENMNSSILENTIVTPVLMNGVSLPNSEPPDDWEMLLEEEEEEAEDEAAFKELKSNNMIANEKVEYPSRLPLSSKMSEVNRLKFSQLQKSDIENRTCLPKARRGSKF